MIKQAAYGVEPWSLRESGLNMDLLAQSESVFALSNGHIGLRGNLDEGEPHGLPGTYLNSFYEQRPLPYAEAGYGYPESGQTVINVTNGKLIRLLVDDEPFDIRYGTLSSHERVLDLRAGTLTGAWTGPHRPGRGSASRRSGSCRSPSGPSPRSGTRSSRWTAGCGWSCSPSSWPTSSCRTPGRDPRAAAALEAPLVSEEYQADNDGQSPRDPGAQHARSAGCAWRPA